MKHDWFAHPKFHPLVTCRACGVVKRTDGKNGPCKGKVRVVLRDNRTRNPQNESDDMIGQYGE